MISAEQNQRLTRVGPGTPGGRLLREYWQPVALTSELDALQDGVVRPVIPVRLCGQDFVLFRRPDGQPALLDRHCPHRGADLSYGRLEDGGLRCPFHGWLFDGDGRCLQTPAEPAGSRLCDRVVQKAWPVRERSGVIFAWLGERQPAELPALDCFVAPASHTFAFKGLWRCNWLQAHEVGIDPAHASFLHRFVDDGREEDAYGKQFRSTSANSELTMAQVLGRHEQPDIDVEPAPWGLRLVTTRRLDEQQTHVRVTNALFPNAIVIPLSETMTITQWHAPIDDEHTYWVTIFTSFDEPVDAAAMLAQRLAMHTLPDYAPLTHAGNRYGFSARDQQRRTYTGLGEDINVHDQWAVESPGAISDRTREHLGTTDKAIMTNRRMLLKAMAALEQGEDPPGFLGHATHTGFEGPATIDGVCRGADPADLMSQWQALDATRRARAPWRAASRVSA